MNPTLTPFPMYDFRELAEAHDALWRAFAALVRCGGFTGEIPLMQICGYPLVTSLRGRYDAVAAPVYDVPLGAGATHCGLIVVGTDSSHATLEDLRGTRFALNAWDSNTGMNLPRRLFAPLAERGRFFGDVVETGSHLASLAAVGRGAADVASIDIVTFALLAEHRPGALDGVRVLASTPAGPTLPYAVPASTDRALAALLYDALAAAIAESRGSERFDALHIARIERTSNAAYDDVLRYEREASALGYGTLR